MTPRLDDIRRDDDWLDALGSRRDVDGDEAIKLLAQWVDAIDHVPSVPDQGERVTGWGADEPACKPDPVPTSLAGAWVATIHLGPPSPAGSSGLPAGLGRAALGRPARPVLADRPS